MSHTADLHSVLYKVGLFYIGTVHYIGTMFYIGTVLRLIECQTR